MIARFDGERYVVDVTAQQFKEMVETFFKRNAYPTIGELKSSLVPSGVPNTAREGSFGPNGIFKYVFRSSDDVLLMVKYHKADAGAWAKDPTCNSALGWTSQIICDDCTFFTWDNQKKIAGTCRIPRRKAKRGVAPQENLAHIPVRNDSSRGAKDQTHMSEVSFAGDSDIASFVFIM